MTFDKINRRTHLYSGLLLSPWFVLYAVSGFIFNHPSKSTGSAEPSWQLRYDHPYRMPVITESNEDAMAQKLLEDQALTGRYWVDTNDPESFIVYRARFLKTVRFTYMPKELRIRREEQALALPQFLMAAHVRSGFDFPYALEVMWAGVVDIVAVSIVIWVASGLYIWWKLKRFRFWGCSAIAAGCAAFILLALGL